MKAVVARIPDSDIELLKEEVSLERLVEASGVELRAQGKDLVGCCPFHEDRTPSLVITPGKNLWHCLGACQSGGSVIDWVMRVEGVSFRHAVELLRDGAAPSSMTAGGRPSRVSTVRRLPSPVQPTADDRELLARVVWFYGRTLAGSPEALGFLERRGLTHPELIDVFRLGFANRTLGYRLPAKNRQAGAEIRGRLQRLGVLRESGHEHFSGSLVIPVLDSEGFPVQLYGRKIRGDLKAGTPVHLYLPGSRRGVFNRPALTASREVILCESLIDALSFWTCGLRHVTAAYGVQGFTDEHLQAFKASGIERVVVAYDPDDAGDHAAAKLADRLGAEGIECCRVRFPVGQDANSLITSVKDPADVLAELLDIAVPIGQVVKRVRLASPACVEPPAAAPAVAPVTEPAGIEESIIVGESAGVSFLADESPREGVWLGKERQPEPLSASPQSLSDSPGPQPTQPVPPLSDSPGPSSAVPGPQPAPLVSPVAVLPVPVVGLPAGSSVWLEGEDLHVEIEDRGWRVRGLSRVTSFQALRLNVLVAREDERRGRVFHLDTLDLYSARARGVFCRQAAGELGVAEEQITRDLGRVLLVCEQQAAEAIRQAQQPQETAVVLSEQDRTAALGLLTDPGLVDRIVTDFGVVGVVGEEMNCLVGYLAAVSRKLDRPLAVIVQSTSAAGKSALQDAVLSMVPEQERVSFSAMTGQSLFYMGESDLQHKVLAVSEEQGAERAAYALKLLQSEGGLSIASTGKDPASGRLVTHTYQVRGPVAIFLTTTAVDVDEELLNRCVVLTVDEDREQTRRIHERQRLQETLEGLLADRRRRAVLKVHQDAQRLLEPVAVVNPFATSLGFSDHRTRTRRDHVKYLRLYRYRCR